MAGTARAAPPELLWIDASDPESLRLLEATTVAPVRILDGYALAWAPADALSEVHELGLAARSLGLRRPDRQYAVVYSPGRSTEEKTKTLVSFGRILGAGVNTVILEYRPEDADRLCASYEIVPILDRPLRRARPGRVPLPSAPPEPDPTIAGYVRGVEVDTLQKVCLRLENFGDRRSYNPGCHLASAYLAELFQSYGLTDVTLFDYAPSDFCDDVVAVQPGRVSPEEIYVIGGHHDSTSRAGAAPGADDNASGTAAAMEAARILASETFEATIIYIAFGGEEQGLLGSEGWAGWARDQGLDIRGAINLDMIGYLPPGYIGDLDLIADANSRDLLNLALIVSQIYLPDYQVIEGYLSAGSSDHQSFWDNGYAALTLNEDSVYNNPYYHTSLDRVGPSLNDFPFMQKNVQAAVALLATLARPLRIVIDHTPLDDPSSDAEDYPVLARFESHVVPLWEDSLCVRYRVDGGSFSTLQMEAVGDSDLYAATIPRQGTGRLVEYEIYARDVEGRTAHDPRQAPEKLHSFVVGRLTAYAEHFEEDAGWLVSGDAASGAWIRDEPVGTRAQPAEDVDPDPGRSCFVTGNGLPGDETGAHDVDGGQTILTSPAFDLSGASGVDLIYSRWFVDETYPDDSLRVLISNDDGINWVLLEAVGAAEPAWKEARFDSVETLLPLTERMRLQFVAEDVGNPSLVEAAIDRVIVKGIYPVSPPPLDRSRITSAWPVPFRDQVMVGYGLLHESTVHLSVYDLRGRLVGEIEGGVQPPGLHEVLWDGRDAQGESVPSGIYFLRLAVGGGPASTLRVPRVR